MKKLIYVLALAATLLGFVSCNPETAEIPYVKITTDKGDLIANGNTYKPTEINYIDLTFDQPMDTTRRGFLGFWFDNPKGNTWYQIQDHKWVNDYTYRIWVYLMYNRNFKISWNDESYTGEDYTKQDNFFKSKKGAYAEFKTIDFNTTKQSTEPNEFVIDIRKSDELSVKLGYNEYGDETSKQQLIVSWLNTFLDHHYVKPGDTVTFKYALKSQYDLSKVRVNLVDSSRQKDSNGNYTYWNLLTASEDGQFLVDDTYEPKKEYEGSITFNITTAMIDSLDVQFFAPLDELNPEYYSIQFIQK